MKKINEEILKYLSGSMNESEMKLFEEKLKISEDLNYQLNSAVEALSELNLKNIDANEAYFNNIVPRVRQRLETEKRFSILKRLYYLAPAFTIVLLAILFYPQSNNIPGNNYHELAEVVVNNINDEDVTNRYVNNIMLDPSYSLLIDNIDFSVGLENTNDRVPDSYFNLLDYSNTEIFRTLSNLPDEDLESLYKELNNIKFQ